MGKGRGGGGLRILPHKSWHVWNQNNLDRVRHDEEEHEAEEEEKRADKQTVDTNDRTTIMRKRNRKKLKTTAEKVGMSLGDVFSEADALAPEHFTHTLQPEETASAAVVMAPDSEHSTQLAPMSENSPSAVKAQTQGHINLFADEEQQAHSSAAAPKKRKQPPAPDFSKPSGKMGIMGDTVFAQADKDTRGFRAWYTVGQEERVQTNQLAQRRKESEGAKKRYRGANLKMDMKTVLDPMTQINALLGESSKGRAPALTDYTQHSQIPLLKSSLADSDSSSSSDDSDTSSSSSDSGGKRRKKKKGKSKKKKKKSSKHKKKSSSKKKKKSSSKKQNKETSIEALRRARKERETAERSRQNTVLGAPDPALNTREPAFPF